MEAIGISRLRTLVHAKEEPALSVYLPAHAQEAKNKARLEQSFEKANNLLESKYPGQADSFLKSIRESSELFAEILTKDGLCIFKSPSFEGYYRTHQENPEFISVNNHFHLKPLLGVFPKSQEFYLLRLEESGAKLYLGNADQLAFVKQIQGEKPGDATASSHEDEATRKRRWLPLVRAAESEVSHRVAKQSTPVVVVGPRKLVLLYRAMNRHQFLAGYETDHANLFSRSLRALHSVAWPIASHILETAIEQRVCEYEEMAPLGRATSDMAEIVSAAGAGRVKRLLVAREAEIWGHIDYSSGVVQMHGKQPNLRDGEILDELAQIVLRQDGEVSLAPQSRMPESAPAVAILRA